MSELLCLGTGAADTMHKAFPDNFDNKDNRRCTASLLDGHILLDCGPHVLQSLAIAGADLQNITDVIFTHLHSDHCNIDNLTAIANVKTTPLHVWYIAGDAMPQIENIVLHPVKLFETYEGDGFTLTGLPGNHGVPTMHPSIEIGGKKLLYALDGAWFTYDAVEHMKKKQYDAVVLDCTVGDYLGDYRMGEHNSVPMLRVMVPSMRTLDIIKEGTKVVLDHLATCLHKSYAETCALVKNDNFTVAFDGLKLEI